MNQDGPSLERREVDAEEIPCPYCGALPGKKCQTVSKMTRANPHQERVSLAKPRRRARGV